MPATEHEPHRDRWLRTDTRRIAVPVAAASSQARAGSSIRARRENWASRAGRRSPSRRGSRNTSAPSATAGRGSSAATRIGHSPPRQSTGVPGTQSNGTRGLASCLARARASHPRCCSRNRRASCCVPRRGIVTTVPPSLRSVRRYRVARALRTNAIAGSGMPAGPLPCATSAIPSISGAPRSPAASPPGGAGGRARRSERGRNSRASGRQSPSPRIRRSAGGSPRRGTEPRTIRQGGG